MKLRNFFTTVLFTAVLAACGGGGESASPTVTPTTSVSANIAPVARAGTTQNVIAGTLVTLDGSTSSDADNDSLTYKWTLTSKAAGSAATLVSPTSAKPTFTADVAGTYVLTLIVNDGKADSAANSSVTVTASTVNAAPVANAGSPQSVVKGGVVTLDGSSSSDANGDALTYAWSLTVKPAGSAAVLASPSTSVKPSFTADVAGSYMATLIVNDGKVDSAAATVAITASTANAAPVANAGAAQSVVTGAVVALNGSTSSDANGDSLTYAWALTSKPVGSLALLSSPTSANPAFTADVAGTFVASLVVNDGQVNSTAVTVAITAATANAAPVANAGVAQSLVSSSLVTLDGSASSDANGDALTYFWSLTAKPAGSTATLASASSVKPTFTADVAGTYAATLTVNDGKANSASSTVTITVSVANATPVANAGPNQNIVAGSMATLDGSASSDANGDPLTYAWALTSKPAGSSATLVSPTSAKPSFTADITGTYVTTLVVNDGKINSSSSTVTVTASVANAAPVANAGMAQSVVSGGLVTLDGSASSDANGDPLTYGWSLTAKPAGSSTALASFTSVKPTFIADVTGVYAATLIVNDGKVNSTAATVTITATAASSITLLEPADPFFGGSDRVLSWPYSSSGPTQKSCIGSCAALVDIATFKLQAVGKSYTIANLQAVNSTLGSSITPIFSGLNNGQTLTDGQTATFKLQSPYTGGTTVNLNYTFTVQETGQTFSYTVQLRTN